MSNVTLQSHFPAPYFLIPYSHFPGRAWKMVVGNRKVALKKKWDEIAGYVWFCVGGHLESVCWGQWDGLLHNTLASSCLATIVLPFSDWASEPGRSYKTFHHCRDNKYHFYISILIFLYRSNIVYGIIVWIYKDFVVVVSGDGDGMMRKLVMFYHCFTMVTEVTWVWCDAGWAQLSIMNCNLCIGNEAAHPTAIYCIRLNELEGWGLCNIAQCLDSHGKLPNYCAYKITKYWL